MKKKKNKEILDIIKAARKLSREEEIKLHGKLINQTRLLNLRKCITGKISRMIFFKPQKAQKK